jgi:hypothetical protein
MSLFRNFVPERERAVCWFLSKSITKTPDQISVTTHSVVTE